jgi:hypothetical protein
MPGRAGARNGAGTPGEGGTGGAPSAAQPLVLAGWTEYRARWLAAL